MVKSKPDNLLDMVRRSGLVDQERFARVLADLQTQGGDAAVTDDHRVTDKLVAEGLLTPWQRDNLLHGRYKGFFVKKYKLLDHLGTGGMSSVYLAEHTLMQRRVALKVLPKNRVKDSSYLARFHREARAAAALDHRNIVRAYDVDNDGEVHFLVMEYVEGCDLQTMVKNEGPLEFARAADYIRQAAEGLHHAHQAGLIHRDVKPANLLVDRHHVVKVLDLGLARFTEEQRGSLTVAYDENVLGTADYLAPEQAINSHGVDARADIYSLGCSLYYLLTGRPPFPEGTLPQRLMMHQKVPPPDIRLKRPDAPEDLMEICLRMMAKKAAARFQSAQEVTDALAQWLRAHGHALDTAAGSGSASPLTASSSGTRLPQAGQASPSGAGSSRRLARAAALEQTQQGSPSTIDPAAASAETKSKIGLGTTKGGGSGSGGLAAPASGAGTSSSKLRGQAALLLARRLEAVDPLAEIAAAAGEVIGGSGASRKGVTDEQLAAYQSRKKVPRWAWWAIAGGALLAILLLVLLLMLF